MAAPVGVVDRGALQSVAAAGHHAGSGYFQSVQRVGDTRQQPYPVVARVVHAGTDFQRVHGRSLIGSVAQVADAVPTAVGHDVRPFGDDPHPFSPVDPARAVCVIHVFVVRVAGDADQQPSGIVHLVEHQRRVGQPPDTVSHAEHRGIAVALVQLASERVTRDRR